MLIESNPTVNWVWITAGLDCPKYENDLKLAKQN